jgi:hypothetical protein
MALNHDQGKRLRGGSHENRSFRRIIQSAYKFLAGSLCFSFSPTNQPHKNSVNISFWSQPKQNTPHYFLYLMNYNLANDQHSGARGSVVVKTIRYKPEGRGFETRFT